MPCVLIEVRQQYTQEIELALMEAVHKAVRDAFHSLAHERNIRLVVHAAHRFQCPPNKAQPQYYTLISIDVFADYSLAAKRNLYQNIIHNLEPFDIPKDHIKIVLREQARDPHISH